MSLPKGFLEGRTAIVTGATSPVGRHIARALADTGMNLFLTGRRAETLDQAARDIAEQTGVKVVTCPVDLTETSASYQITNRVLTEFGRIDVLVNNAGIDELGHFHEMSVESLRNMVEINLCAALFLTHAVLPSMLEQRWGHIVNISAAGAKQAPPYMAGYAASKAALIGLTQSIRLEYRSRGIRASVICPGFIEGGGLYERLKQLIHRTTPKAIGCTDVETVAKKTVKAIRHDVPEVLTNSPPVRPLLIASAFFPRLGEWLLRKFHAHFYRRIGRAKRRQTLEQQRSNKVA